MQTTLFCLQKVLNILHSWCHKWRISVNESKSEIVHFRNLRKKAPCLILNMEILV